MNVRRGLGIAVAVCGVVLLFVSFYIRGQVAEGEEQISSAKQKVGTIDKLFSVTPETKQLGKGITDPAHKQIQEGEQQVSYYSQLSGKIQIGGIVLIIAGAVIIFYPTRKRR